MRLPSDECRKTSWMINQHCFRIWLGAIRQQAITWANFDPDLCRHMPSLGHNAFNWQNAPISCTLRYAMVCIYWVIWLNKQVSCSWFVIPWCTCNDTLQFSEYHSAVCFMEMSIWLLSHPSILGVTLCFCTGSYATAGAAAASRRFLFTR